MFFIKKIIGNLLQPLSFCFIVSLVGLLILLRRRSSRAGRLLVGLGLVLLYLSSSNIVGDLLIEPLESQYQPFNKNQLDPLQLSQIKWIVVLSGGNSPRAELPSTAQLSGDSITRLTEGLRILQQIPQAQLLVSGGSVYGWTAEGTTMAILAQELGVDPKRIVKELASKDTEQQALNVKAIVKDDPVVLVTSAFHMRRSMGLFKKQGMLPIAAPTAHRAHADPYLRFQSLLPTGSALQRTNAATHEYFGIWWAQLQGKM